MSIPTVDPSLIDPCRFQEAKHYDAENQARILADLEAHKGLLNNPLHLIRKDDRWECLAGHDRLEAAKRAGAEYVSYRDFTGVVVSDEDVYSHWRRDNTLRKTIDRREAAVETLTRWPEWSDRRVAETVGCSHTLVQNIRSALEAIGAVATVATRIGKDGVKQSAAKPRTGTRTNGTPKRSEARDEGESVVRELGADEVRDSAEGATAPETPSGSPVSTEPGEGNTSAGTVTDESDSPDPSPSSGSPDDDERMAHLLTAESALTHAASFRAHGQPAIQILLDKVRAIIRTLRQEAA